MPGLSSSQEMQLEYFIWQAPELPPVAIRRRAMDGIHREVSEAFASAPHRGAETGGILLGRREEDRIVVEDFEPVLSEHRFGPSFRLSDTDCELLHETLEWFRGGAQPGLSVLGYYCTHTLPEMDLCPEDEDLMRTYFGEAEDLVLLVRPGLRGSSEEDFSVRRGGRLAEHSAIGPQADTGLAPDPPPLMAWPAPRPRLSKPEPETESDSKDTAARRVGWRWLWYVAAAALGLTGGALVYVWWHPNAGVDPIALATVAPSPALPVVERASAPPEPAAPAAPDTAGVHELLDRWSGALKRGDVETAAKCYAPVVSTYFDRHYVTREAVRQSIRTSRARYIHLDIYRISGLGITPVSEGRAVATFRKHWRTSGRGRSSGEENERMTLVRNEGVWQISSEQAEKR